MPRELGAPRASREDVRPRRRTRAAGPGAALFCVFVLAFYPLFAWLPDRSLIPAEVRDQAAILWLLCVLPSLLYLRTPGARRPPLPFLPLLGLGFGTLYALQIVRGGDPVVGLIPPPDPRHDYAAPVSLALKGWVSLLVAFAALRTLLPERRIKREAAIDTRRIHRQLLMGFAASVVLDVALSYVTLPTAIRGIFNFALSAGFVCLGLLIVDFERGLLRRELRVALLACVGVFFAARLGSGLLEKLLTPLALILICSWIANRRVRLYVVVLVALLTPGVVAFKGVLLEYRDRYWFAAVPLSPTERTAALIDILVDKIERVGIGGTIADGMKTTAVRASADDLLSDVVIRTPFAVPYWGGHTYLSLVGLAVPRVLWPNKPQKTLGQDFGHRYGYLSTTDRYTSINLPYLVEFYVNFGEAGVVVGMFITGALLLLITRRFNVPGQNTTQSVFSLVLLLPLTSTEADFSLLFGGVFLNAVALYAFYVVLRRLARAPRPARRATRELAVERP